jgi:hypothetical protein
MAKSHSRSRSRSRSPKRSVTRSAKRCPSKIEGCCLKCKKTVVISGCKMTKTSKGQPMCRGKCPKCGTTVTRFVSRQ